MWRKMLVILAVSYSSAFNSPKPILVKPTVSSQQYDESSRRTFIATLSSVSLAIGSTLMQSLPVGASGGATAGGAYLLSAKQRYNDRVISGLKGFLALEPSLKAGSVEEAKAYFAGTQQGEFGDISTAGYLLANAFRRSSNTAPDALPSVKVCMDSYVIENLRYMRSVLA